MYCFIYFVNVPEYFSPSALSITDNSTDLDPAIDPATLKMYDEEREGNR